MSEPPKNPKENSSSRFFAENWKPFSAGSLMIFIPFALNYHLEQKDDWDSVDQEVTLLVNTVIDLDTVPPDIQPAAAAQRSERVRFVRDYQSANHQDDWTLLAKQIPEVSEGSELGSYRRAVSGHRSVARRVHGPEPFAKAELKQRTELIENGFDGEVFDGPISLLAFVSTPDFEQLIPATESNLQVKWLLVSQRQLSDFEYTPRLDLSNPTVMKVLEQAGFQAAAFSENTAVPALTELSDSAYQVQTVAWR